LARDSWISLPLTDDFGRVSADPIGPTLGGWITDNYSWRWIFYINVPVGILAVLLVSQLIQDPPYLSSLKKITARFDYIGFALLVIGVGALQIALDKGQEDDWFGSRFITTLITLTATGLVSLVYLGVAPQGTRCGCPSVQNV
jgi:DHA2 family multidrug resistance protein